MSNIVLNTLTYVGTGILNGISQWWERSKSLVNAFSLLTNRISYNPSKTVVAWKLTVPVVREADSACGCAGEVVRTTIADIVIRFDRNATAAERLDVKERIEDLVASTQFASSITDLVQPT